jgi:hypothetical protein
MKCPWCEVGNLTPVVWGAKFTFIDKPVEGLEGMKCDTCDAEPILTDQIRRNEVKIDAARAADYLQSDAATEPKCSPSK